MLGLKDPENKVSGQFEVEGSKLQLAALRWAVTRLVKQTQQQRWQKSHQQLET